MSKDDIILFTYIILDIACGIHNEMQTSNLMLQNIWMSMLTSKIIVLLYFITYASWPMPLG